MENNFQHLINELFSIELDVYVLGKYQKYVLSEII